MSAVTKDKMQSDKVLHRWIMQPAHGHILALLYIKKKSHTLAFLVVSTSPRTLHWLERLTWQRVTYPAQTIPKKKERSHCARIAAFRNLCFKKWQRNLTTT